MIALSKPVSLVTMAVFCVPSASMQWMTESLGPKPDNMVYLLPDEWECPNCTNINVKVLNEKGELVRTKCSACAGYNAQAPRAPVVPKDAFHKERSRAHSAQRRGKADKRGKPQPVKDMQNVSRLDMSIDKNIKDGIRFPGIAKGFQLCIRNPEKFKDYIKKSVERELAELQLLKKHAEAPKLVKQIEEDLGGKWYQYAGLVGSADKNSAGEEKNPEEQKEAADEQKEGEPDRLVSDEKHDIGEPHHPNPEENGAGNNIAEAEHPFRGVAAQGQGAESDDSHHSNDADAVPQPGAQEARDRTIRNFQRLRQCGFPCIATCGLCFLAGGIACAATGCADACQQCFGACCDGENNACDYIAGMFRCLGCCADGVDFADLLCCFCNGVAACCQSDCCKECMECLMCLAECCKDCGDC